MDTKVKCVLCKDEIEDYGNNAEPLAKGLCCDGCNLKVILARIKEVSKRQDHDRYNVAQKKANEIFDKAYGKDKNGP